MAVNAPLLGFPRSLLVEIEPAKHRLHLGLEGRNSLGLVRGMARKSENVVADQDLSILQVAKRLRVRVENPANRSQVF